MINLRMSTLFSLTTSNCGHILMSFDKFKYKAHRLWREFGRDYENSCFDKIVYRTLKSYKYTMTTSTVCSPLSLDSFCLIRMSVEGFKMWCRLRVMNRNLDWYFKGKPVTHVCMCVCVSLSIQLNPRVHVPKNGLHPPL